MFGRTLVPLKILTENAFMVLYVWELMQLYFLLEGSQYTLTSKFLSSLTVKKFAVFCFVQHFPNLLDHQTPRRIKTQKDECSKEHILGNFHSYYWAVAVVTLDRTNRLWTPCKTLWDNRYFWGFADHFILEVYRNRFLSLKLHLK